MMAGGEKFNGSGRDPHLPGHVTSVQCRHRRHRAPTPKPERAPTQRTALLAGTTLDGTFKAAVCLRRPWTCTVKVRDLVTAALPVGRGHFPDTPYSLLECRGQLYLRWPHLLWYVSFLRRPCALVTPCLSGVFARLILTGVEESETFSLVRRHFDASRLPLRHPYRFQKAGPATLSCRRLRSP